MEAFEGAMTWLIVGASGQLGKSLCAELQDRNIAYVEWNRIDGSILDFEFVSKHVARIRPKVLVNAAAWTDVDGAESNEDEAELINAGVVGFLAAAAKNVNAVLIQISTDYVFSGVASNPWDEQSEKSPVSAYGRGKAKGEDLALESYSEGTYIFRTAWLYSQYGKNFAKTMARLAFKDSEIVRVVDDQIGQPTFAGDLANQIIDSVQKEIPFGIYHATNSGVANWFDFAKTIFELGNQDLNRVIGVTSAEYPRPAIRPKYSVLGHDAWKKTGVDEMRDWKAALSEAMPAIIKSVRMEE